MSLKNLILDNNNIKKIENLEKIKSLQNLSINKNNINDLSGIEKLIVPAKMKSLNSNLELILD